VEGRPEVREEWGTSGFRPGGRSRHGGVGGDEGFNPVGMSVEPILEDGGQAGRLRRGGRQRRECGKDTCPVCFCPVRRGGRESEPGRVERDENRDMVRTGRFERSIPFSDRREKWAIGEGEVKDRRPGVVCKRKASIQTRLVEKGVAALRGMTEVGLRQVVLSRIKPSKGVGGRVMEVEITNHQGREGVILK